MSQFRSHLTYPPVSRRPWGYKSWHIGFGGCFTPVEIALLEKIKIIRDDRLPQDKQKKSFHLNGWAVAL
jgi:hypothetical protein